MQSKGANQLDSQLHISYSIQGTLQHRYSILLNNAVMQLMNTASHGLRFWHVSIQ
jgi:hypothetical protein